MPGLSCGPQGPARRGHGRPARPARPPVTNIGERIHGVLDALDTAFADTIVPRMFGGPAAATTPSQTPRPLSAMVRTIQSATTAT